MAGNSKQETQEFSSDQLKAELIEIKERLGSLETVASLANREIIEKLVLNVLRDVKKREIMAACQEPCTKSELIERFGHGSRQALDYHLTPLRQNDLVHESRDPSGTQVFQWSKLFKHLPKRNREKLLNSSEL